MLNASFSVASHLNDAVQREALHRLLKPDLNKADQIVALRQLQISHISSDLLAYAVALFRERMVPVSIDHPYLVDLCGTGGDKSGTFNISTTAAFVVAGAGIPVAKHGNGAISSKSGSANLLSALGVAMPKTPDEARAQCDKAGICFLFAPYFHPSFAGLTEARKELAGQGELTLFNLLGPLLNPALVKRAALGVFQPGLVELMAETLKATETVKGLVFSGDGLDELTLTGLNSIAEIKDKITLYSCMPKDFGMNPCDKTALQGGSPQDNAEITQRILAGEQQGPKADMVILNAAAAIYAASDQMTLEQAITRAELSLNSGAALKVLEACRS
jgi:anthranilate phosphoribosyltransferase